MYHRFHIATSKHANEVIFLELNKITKAIDQFRLRDQYPDNCITSCVFSDCNSIPIAELENVCDCKKTCK